MEKINIVLADDHALVREGLRLMLKSLKGIEIVGEACDGREAVELIEEKKPDLALLDIRMPVMNGLEALEQIKKKKLSTKVIFLSMEMSQEQILKACKNGASGYVLKDIRKDRLIESIRRVHLGEEYFDSRVSHEVLNNLCKKKTSHLSGKKTKLFFEIMAILVLEILAGSVINLLGI